MALREDYYTPCIDEINSRIGAIEEVKDEIESRNYDEEFGVENSGSSDDIEEKIKKIITKLDDMIEILYSEKNKLAQNSDDLKDGWF